MFSAWGLADGTGDTGTALPGDAEITPMCVVAERLAV
jgi:hypothetical protein